MRKRIVSFVLALVMAFAMFVFPVGAATDTMTFTAANTTDYANVYFKVGTTWKQYNGTATVSATNGAAIYTKLPNMVLPYAFNYSTGQYCTSWITQYNVGGLKWYTLYDAWGPTPGIIGNAYPTNSVSYSSSTLMPNGSGWSSIPIICWDSDGTTILNYSNYLEANGAFLNIPNPEAREGKIFKGWALTAGATSAAFAAGSTSTSGIADVATIKKNLDYYWSGTGTRGLFAYNGVNYYTGMAFMLYAVWEDIPKYTISQHLRYGKVGNSFSANGGQSGWYDAYTLYWGTSSTGVSGSSTSNWQRAVGEYYNGTVLTYANSWDAKMLYDAGVHNYHNNYATDYKVTKWSTTTPNNLDANNTVNFASGTNYTVTKNQTLSPAKWEPIDYRLTFDVTKGINSDNSTYNVSDATITTSLTAGSGFTANTSSNTKQYISNAHYNYAYSSMITRVPVPTRTGYDFGGWYHTSGFGGSTKFPAGSAATSGDYYSLHENTTLYPRWTVKTSTVTLNNQSATTAGTASVTATYGQAMPTITPPSKTGNLFGGYFDGQNGTGNQYYNADGTSARTWDKEASSVTLYAKWNPNVYYNIYFHGNGANGGVPADQSILAGQNFDLTTVSVPTHDDFTDNDVAVYSSSGRMPQSFLGWATSSGATTPTYKYDHSTGTFDTSSFTVNSNVNLYAVWCKHDSWRTTFANNPFSVNWANVTAQIYARSRCTVCGAEVQRSHNLAFNARQKGLGGANIILYSDTLFVPYDETTFNVDISRYPLPCESGSKTEARFEGWRLHGRASENAALITLNSTYPLDSTTTGGYSTNFFASYEEGYYEMVLDAGEFGSTGYGSISRSNLNTTTSATANSTSAAGNRRYEIVAIYGTDEAVYIKGKLDGAAVTSSFPKADFSESSWVFYCWHSMCITNVETRAYATAQAADQEFRLAEYIEDYTANPVIINAFITYNGLNGNDVYCLADYMTYTSVSGVTTYPIRYYANNLGSSTGYNQATFSSYNGPFAGTLQNNGKRVETSIITVSDAKNKVGNEAYSYYYFPTVATDPSGEDYDNSAYSTPIGDQKSANTHTYFYLNDDISGTGKFKTVKEIESSSRFYWQQEYLQIDRNDNTSTLKAGNYGVAPHPASNHRFNVYNDGITGSVFNPVGYGDLTRFYDEPNGVWACYLQWDLGIRYLPYYIDESTNAGKAQAAALAVYNFIETSTTNYNFYFLSADFYDSDGAEAVRSAWARNSKMEITGWYIDTNNNHAYDEGTDLYFSADEKVNDSGYSCYYNPGTINYAVSWYVNRVANYASAGEPLTMYAVWKPVVELVVNVAGSGINNGFNNSSISYVDKFGKQQAGALSNFRVVENDSKKNYAIIKIQSGSEVNLSMYSTNLSYIAQNNRTTNDLSEWISGYYTKADRVVSNSATYNFYAATDTYLTAYYGGSGDAVLDRNNKLLPSSGYDPFSLYRYGNDTARTRPAGGANSNGLYNGSETPNYLEYDGAAEYTVTVVGSTYGSENGARTDQQYDRCITVRTAPKNGAKYFAGWTINNRVVSYDPIYTFRVTGSVTITASYDSSAPVQKGRIEIVGSGTSADGRKYVTSERYAPAGSTFVESGFIVSSNQITSTTPDPDAGGLVSGNYVYDYYKVTTTDSNLNGSFKLIVPSGSDYYVMAYYYYLDSNGNIQKAYSNSQQIN